MYRHVVQFQPRRIELKLGHQLIRERQRPHANAIPPRGAGPGIRANRPCGRAGRPQAYTHPSPAA
jgi:hypothetical protein